MILKGAGVCPFIKIGDVVKGRTVTDLVCDRLATVTCRAFRALAMIMFGEGLETRDYMHPVKVSWVNCNECPILIKDPNHYYKTKWCRELVQAARERGEAVDRGATVQEPTEKGAGVCPFIKIGDVVKGGTVTDLVCDKNLAMIVVERGHEMYDYIHPASVSWVNCNECPKLVKDPNHYSKTKWCRELVQAAEATVQEPTEKGAESLEHEDPNRFDIIDISDEEEQNGKSSGNPNQ